MANRYPPITEEEMEILAEVFVTNLFHLQEMFNIF